MRECKMGIEMFRLQEAMVERRPRGFSPFLKAGANPPHRSKGTVRLFGGSREVRVLVADIGPGREHQEDRGVSAECREMDPEWLAVRAIWAAGLDAERGPGQLAQLIGGQIWSNLLEQGGQQPAEVAALLAAFFRDARSSLHLAIYDFRLSDALAAPVIEALTDRLAADLTLIPVTFEWPDARRDPIQTITTRS